MTLVRTALILSCILLFEVRYGNTQTQVPPVAPVAAPKLTLVAAGPDKNRAGMILVTISGTGILQPDNASQHHWTLVYTNVQGQLISASCIPQQTGAYSVLLPAPADLKADAAFSVTVDTSSMVSFDLSSISIKPAKPLGLRDYNFTAKGSYSPAIGSAAQYQLSSSGFLQVAPLSSHDHYLGGAYSISMDQRQDVDPDSFMGSLVYYGDLWEPDDSSRVGGVKMYFYGSGVEADRRDDTLNFISSVLFTLPLRPFPANMTAQSPGSLALTPVLGVEGGDNIKNVVTGTGLGGFVRGYAGADFDLILGSKANGLTVGSKKIKLGKSLELFSVYRVRVPGMQEVYTTTVDKVDTSVLSTKARHHVTSELDLNFTNWLSISATYEHGELPPVYRRIDNKASIGLKIALDSTKAADVNGLFSGR